MIHKEKLIMHYIKKSLKDLEKKGIGRIVDYVEDEGRIYYGIDDAVIVISVDAEGD